MKELDKKKKITIIAAAAVLLLIILIAVVFKQSKSTNPYGEEIKSVIKETDVGEIGDTLRAAGLSNVDLFETWVYEYHENKNKQMQSDAYSDTDCRMAAMLLLDDQISCDGAEDYTGDYLMVDVNKIEHEDTYLFIRDNLHVFTTLFGETPIPSGGMKDALPENWKKHNLKVFNNNASLVSLIFTTTDGKEVFTGHTGVLIDCSKLDDSPYENYLFVEKLAFGEAFMATELSDPSGLIDLFSQRPDYTTEEGEPKPLVFINDELLGELK